LLLAADSSSWPSAIQFDPVNDNQTPDLWKSNYAATMWNAVSNYIWQAQRVLFGFAQAPGFKF